MSRVRLIAQELTEKDIRAEEIENRGLMRKEDFRSSEMLNTLDMIYLFSKEEAIKKKHLV